MNVQVNNIFQISSFKSTQIKSSRNPVKIFKMMKMYSNERNQSYPYLEAIINTINAVLTNCKLRFVNDSFGKLLAGYTYCVRKNGLDEKSLYIDVLVRNRANKASENLMTDIYKDMKNIATQRKAKEMSLFSLNSDLKLREKYEKLGFRKDEKTWVNDGYFMKTETSKFLQ